MPGARWKPYEDEILFKRYKLTRLDRLAKKLGRSPQALRKRHSLISGDGYCAAPANYVRVAEVARASQTHSRNVVKRLAPHLLRGEGNCTLLPADIASQYIEDQQARRKTLKLLEQGYLDVAQAAKVMGLGKQHLLNVLYRAEQGDSGPLVEIVRKHGLGNLRGKKSTHVFNPWKVDAAARDMAALRPQMGEVSLKSLQRPGVSESCLRDQCRRHGIPIFLRLQGTRLMRHVYQSDIPRLLELASVNQARRERYLQTLQKKKERYAA